MKTNIFTLLTLAALTGLSSLKYSGYEENIKHLIESIQFLSDNFKTSFEPILHYTSNIENYTSNDMLFNEDFKKKLNKFITGMNNIKGTYYRNLKISLKFLNYIRARELSFDLYLTHSYSDTIRFIANFDFDEMEPEMLELFKDFIAQKNYLFYNAKELYKYVKYLTINTINLYDVIETFHEYAKEKDDEKEEYSMEDIKRYYYVLGFLIKIDKYHNSNKEIEDNLMSLLEQWEETLEAFDESLETINIYYHRRYTEGIGSEGEENEPIAVCNNMYLRNFFIKGETKAEEIERFKEIKECPDIEQSCCKKEEIKRMYKRYYNDSVPVSTLKYTTLFEVLSFILDNYAKFQRHAYDIMRNEEASKGECYDKARTLVFNPISKDFVEKFKQFADKTYEFAKNSRAGLYCALCDYDFHKAMMEDSAINLTKDFCDTMIEKTFDYTATYHLQLEEYFNDLIQVLQCDPKTGAFRKETELKFEHSQDIRDILIKCDTNKRENCYDYCSQFYYTRFNAIFDVDFEKIVKLYRFIDNRSKYHHIKTEGSVDERNFAKLSSDFGVEKSDTAHLHIDDLIRKFLEDPDDPTGINPYTDGPTEEDVLRIQLQEEED